MTQTILLPCDGCGQLADTAHISRWLQRLEWATRFRPLHIQVLLVGAIAPARDAEFLYAPESIFEGQARLIFEAAGIPREGKSREAALVEFQKLGLALAHVLGCPLDTNVDPGDARNLLDKQLPAAIARIRRSLKPRKVVLISHELQPFLLRLTEAQLRCAVAFVSAGAEALHTVVAAANPRLL